MSAAGLPFDDIRALVRMLPPPDAEAMAAVRARAASGLGRLAELAEWLAGWQGRPDPAVTRPLVAVFAAAHGIAARNVTEESADGGALRLARLAAGGAPVNHVCGALDIGLKMFELALEVPTRDFCETAALEERECAATMAFGMEALAGGADLISLGDIAVGGDLSAAAIGCALFGGTPAEWLGRTPAMAEPLLHRRIAALAGALSHHGAALSDPLEVLRRLGGRESAASAGAILAARLQRIPVILDGLAASAAAAVLYRLSPDAIDHCRAGHRSTDPVHRRLLEMLRLRPLLDLDIAAGEGTGGALAAAMVRGAVAAVSEPAPAMPLN